MRFTLGEETAAGFHVFDGLRMKTFYYAAGSRKGAQTYVGTRNIIEDIRVSMERETQQVMDMLHRGEEE